MEPRVFGREDGGFKILSGNASYGNIGTTSPPVVPFSVETKPNKDIQRIANRTGSG